MTLGYLLVVGQGWGSRLPPLKTTQNSQQSKCADEGRGALSHPHNTLRPGGLSAPAPYSERTWVPTGQIPWATQGLAQGQWCREPRPPHLHLTPKQEGCSSWAPALKTCSQCICKTRPAPHPPRRPRLHAGSHAPPIPADPPPPSSLFSILYIEFFRGLNTTACCWLSGSQRNKQGLQKPISFLGN